MRSEDKETEMRPSVKKRLTTLNKAEEPLPGIKQELIAIMLEVQTGAERIQHMTGVAKETVSAGAEILVQIKNLTSSLKEVTESAKELYTMMKGTDKQELKDKRKVFVKGLTIGILAGMAGWLIIEDLFK